ncbi:MAG: polysaccharide biosynthesis protein [Oscillospiraceae bacterium]|nr:polysaccharide biosynthesis protein [Oscillospiraceae bacterium]
MKNKRQSFLHGAAVLAVTVAIVKVLGAIYKIPLGNLLGPTGYGYFNKAYSIFSIMLTLSTAGLPVAMSRLVAKADAEGNRPRIREIFVTAQSLFFAFGAIATVVMFLFSGQIAEKMDSPEVAYAIAALSPSVLLVCLTSSYRGYAQGHSSMTPTAVSQVIETLGKLIFGLGFAWYFVSNSYELQYSSAGAIFGVTIGSLLALIYMIFAVKVEKTPIAKDERAKSGEVLKQLLMIGIPVTLGVLPQAIVALFDSFIITPRLAAGGWDHVDARFGVFSQVQTLFNIPASFIVPITVSVIPAIAARLAAKSRDGAAKVTNTALKLSTLLAFPAGVGLSVLSQPILSVVYNLSDSTEYAGITADGTGLLAILGIASFFTCTTLVTNAILQAYGFERVPVYTMIIGGVLKVAGTYFLTPIIGIRGAAIGTLSSFALISILNIVILFVRAKIKPDTAIVRIFIAGAIMGIIAYAAANFAGAFNADLSRMRILFALVIAIGLAIIAYAAMVLGLRIIRKDDLEFLPKGDKLAKVLRIR